MSVTPAEVKAITKPQTAILPASNSIIEILSTPLYLKGLMTNIFFTFGANFLITKMTTGSAPDKWVFFGEDTITNLIFFYLLVPALLTGLRSEIHGAIIEGHVKPLSPYALSNNPLMKGLMYSVAIPSGWIRFIPFVFNVALFPGVMVAGLLMAACQSYTDKSTGTCPLPFYGFIFLDAAWKTFSVMIIYTMNFIACHNEMEPEIALLKVVTKLDEEDKKTK